MKIALVNSTYHPNVIGGAELSVQYLAESLAQQGHAVTVIAAAPQEDARRINGVDVRYVRLRNLYWPYGRRHGVPMRLAWNLLDTRNPLMGSALEAILRDVRPDVVHTNNLQGWSVTAWEVAKRNNWPVVHTIRDLFLLCPRSSMYRHGRNCRHQCISCRLFSASRRPLSKHVDYAVGVSRYMLDCHLAAGWFPRAQCRVIHNSFLPVANLPDRRDYSKMTFGYLGRLDERKGIELLIKSFSALPADTQARLLVAGRGDLQYETLLLHSAKDAAIEFVGRVAPHDLISHCDVLVVPSLLHEALARVIFESYAYGRPVIASRRGGSPEIIEEGITGFLFEPDEPGALTHLMQAIVDDPSNVRSLGPACLVAYRAFTPSEIARQYLAAYNLVTGQGIGGEARRAPGCSSKENRPVNEGEVEPVI